MKKKELIQFIKDKAKEVEVKDFSKEIIEKANRLPYVYHAPKKRSFMLRPIFQLSLVTLTGILVALFLFQPKTSMYAFEDKDDVLVDSAITSLNYLDYQMDELSFNEIQNLSMIESLNYTVEDQLDGVLKFAHLSERLLKPFVIQKSYEHDSYQTTLSFELEDLLGETITIQMSYNEIKVKNNQYEYLGIIDYDQEIFTFSAQTIHGKSNQLQFELSYENQMIHVNYQMKDSVYVYEFSHFQDQTLNIVFEMIRNNQSSNPNVLVSFKQNHTTGTYTFSIDEQNSLVNALYFIARNDQSENQEGKLIITPNAQGKYQIEIRPRGGMPSFVERERPNHPFHGGDHPGDDHGNRPF